MTPLGAQLTPSSPAAARTYTQIPLLTHIPLLCRMRPHTQGARRATGRLGRFEVIEEDDDAEVDEDEEDADGKKKGKKGKKGGSLLPGLSGLCRAG